METPPSAKRGGGGAGDGLLRPPPHHPAAIVADIAVEVVLLPIRDEAPTTAGAVYAEGIRKHCWNT
ncbi:hypothetical protein Sros01_36250 [Streptomyces roseochromogenus]|nr:hypothetical protein Sros01_36250 [Streptomyces roseochromogenus]